MSVHAWGTFETFPEATATMGLLAGKAYCNFWRGQVRRSYNVSFDGWSVMRTVSATIPAGNWFLHFSHWGDVTPCDCCPPPFEARGDGPTMQEAIDDLLWRMDLHLSQVRPVWDHKSFRQLKRAIAKAFRS